MVSVAEQTRLCLTWPEAQIRYHNKSHSITLCLLLPMLYFVNYNVIVNIPSFSRTKPVHARIKKVVSEGVQLWQGFFCFCFFRGERRSKQIPQRAGQHRPASETSFQMAFHWRADNRPKLNADFVALSGPVLQRNPIFL